MTGSLYFHIPFCSRKCPYCHFYVLPTQTHLKEQFLDAICAEYKQRPPPFEVVSIYLGGGTPTQLSPDEIASFLPPIPPGCEVTLEANPEDVTLESMRAYASLGINRVSLGVQSLDDSELTLLGRHHDAAAAIRAIETVHAAGISNISIDLMYELPTQSPTSWQNTLSRLSTLPITHLSLYNLTFEPHTPFHKKQKSLLPLLPTPDENLSMLQSAVSTLSSLGLQRYEISAFAKPGFASRHNTGYWIGRPFFGYGPSAFSYHNGSRFRNIANLSRYATSSSPIDFTETLPPDAAQRELLAIHLRLLSGVNLDTFGPLPPSLHATLTSLQSQGWLTLTGRTLSLTPLGTLFYDSLASEII